MRSFDSARNARSCTILNFLCTFIFGYLILGYHYLSSTDTARSRHFGLLRHTFSKVPCKKAVSPSGIIHAAKSGTSLGISVPRYLPHQVAAERKLFASSRHCLFACCDCRQVSTVCTVQCRITVAHRSRRSRALHHRNYCQYLISHFAHAPSIWATARTPIV